MSGMKTVFIVGPTASGKTALSVELAKTIQGEIVSADSMQIYRGMPIASAVPDLKERQGIPHFLLEFLEPDEEYSVAQYVKAARQCIRQIAARGHCPVVVGGTGLYINALADNLVFSDEKTDKNLRKSLEDQFEADGAEAMLSRLSEIDPETAARLHPGDKRRIIRAFEVYALTGKTFAEQNERSRQGTKEIDPLLIGITFRDRERLYERINLRVDRMLENGLLEEAKAAYSRMSGGAVQAIGHKELFGFFDGTCSLKEAAEHLKQQTRRYAKRQLTWFGKDERIHWLYVDEEPDLLTAAYSLVTAFQKEVVM